MAKKEKQAVTLVDQVRRRAAIAAVAVAVAALSLVFGAYALVSTAVLADQLEGKTVPVVVTTQKIPAGSALTKENTTVAAVPQASCSQDALEGRLLEGAQGRVTLVDLGENTQVSESYLSSSHATTALSAALAEGMEAVSVDVSEVTGIAGLLRVGNLVRVESGDRNSDLTVLCQRKVIALDANLSDASTSYSTVTLEVSPEEAELVRGEQSQGKTIFLTLLAG